MIRQQTPLAEVRAARNTHSPGGDEYDTLLWRLHDANAPRSLPQTVGVTSCLSGEGVSTVAAQLAIRAARSLAGPVLLLETVAAHVIVERKVHLDQAGFAGVLAGEATLDDEVQSTAIDNLFVLGPGSPSVDWGVFRPHSVAPVFQLLRERFEFIVVDLAPVSEPGPCLVIGAQLDGVLLTAEAERVSSPLALRTKHQLQQAGVNLLGVVLNKSRRRLPR